ncbi:hypothetical protein CCHOA_11860 [Corynebacterium choanae]|uniref:Uncharacterized protein n=1 Tax=Corynebacterium choanae TaxID=1862358 RepID=A0A3G6JAB8_9CORY|nr:hypothetical protein CCHOA_11860 [Corynebacterium choanae]
MSCGPASASTGAANTPQLWTVCCQQLIHKVCQVFHNLLVTGGNLAVGYSIAGDNFMLFLLVVARLKRQCVWMFNGGFTVVSSPVRRY